MSKETKFGYGFLLVGAGMPYLIERFVGSTYAYLAALLLVICGIFLLMAGHLHDHKGLASRITIVMLVVCSLLGGFGWRFRPDVLAKFLPAKAPTTSRQNQTEPQRALATSPPKIENPPAVKKKFATKSVGKSESPAFAIDIEHRIFTGPGPYGTSFWFGSFGLSSCSLEPTGTAIFLRITNLQQHKEMITAYSISGLRKIQVLHGRMFVILQNGSIGNGFVPKTIDFGPPAGLGMLVDFPVDDADTSKAIPVTGDFLDYRIGEGHYLETDEAVRGWVFFEYRKDHAAIPGHLTIKITDQFQNSFSYLIPDHIGNPEGDILPRRIVQGPLEDLSKCIIAK
jgi:hypothetical protein